MPPASSNAELPVRKVWAVRTQGAQKKFHEIHWIFNVVTAVVILKNGILDVYESEPGFLKTLPEAATIDRKEPSDLFTVEDVSQGPRRHKDLNRAWNGRTQNAMKKVHEIHAKFGAQTAGLIFNTKKGELMVYESHPGFATLPDGYRTLHRIPKARFTKSRDHRGPTDAEARQDLRLSSSSQEPDILDMSILDKPANVGLSQLRPQRGSSGFLRLGEYFRI
jgi:hypothetical protein